MFEDEIFKTKLTQQLTILLEFDTGTVMNVIYNTLVSWVHRTYKDVPEYKVAYDKFIKRTHDVIRQNNYSRTLENKFWHNTRPKQIEVKTHKDLISELLTILIQMPTEEAIIFLSELTGAWCLSCPKESARQYFDNEKISDVDLAGNLFSWLLRPFDYFN